MFIGHIFERFYKVSNYHNLSTIQELDILLENQEYTWDIEIVIAKSKKFIILKTLSINHIV